MVAERLADRSAMCATCDALVAGLSALMAERPGVLPTAAKLSKRSAISERDLVRHVGDPVGCFVLAFERATDRILGVATASMQRDGASSDRLEALVRTQMRELSADPAAAAIVFGAPGLSEPRIDAAVIEWRRRYTAAVADQTDASTERSRRDTAQRHPAVAAGRRDGG